MSRNIAVIVAAGKGARSGLSSPKQFAPLLGVPVLLWSVRAFIEHPEINEIIVVVSAENREMVGRMISKFDNVKVIPGGAERSDSVRAALDFIGEDEDARIFIHDAARPGLSRRVLDDLILSLDHHDAAAPALIVADALKRKRGAALESVDRDGLHRVQTPQAFHLSAIRAAHEALRGENLVDDLEAAQKASLKIGLVPGDQKLMKLTYAEDFEMAESLLTSQRPPRIGMGYDVHAFAPGDKLHLCGLEIEHEATLKGHSDADVAWHALTDAILGALAGGDIGDHFPPTDEKWRGEPSETFLKHAAEMAREAGYMVANADLTIICEAPRIKPHREAMRQRTADVLGVRVGQVSVKATTTEGLGFTGRREGVAAQAAVVLTPISTLTRG